MPLPSYARVTNLKNGRSLIVRVNDRGPYAANRIIDVSKHAAQLLGFIDRGTTMVRVEYVGPAQIDGSDDRLLEATLRQDEPAPAPGSVRLAAATRIVPVAMTAPSQARFASTGSIDTLGAHRHLAERRRHGANPQRPRPLLILVGKAYDRAARHLRASADDSPQLRRHLSCNARRFWCENQACCKGRRRRECRERRAAYIGGGA